MKKVLIIALLSLSMSMFASKPTYSKWSATVEAGVNRFDGDINQSLTNTFPTSNWNPTFGGNVEYKLTPIYGLSLNGYYVPIDANTNWGGFPIHVTTKISTVAINSTVDFTHLMFPYTKSKVSVNGSIGIGFSHYNYNIYVLSNSYGNAVTMPTSISLKYNASDHFDVGAKVSYICFNKDNLEGLHGWKGVTNDRVGLGTIFVSYINDTTIIVEDIPAIYFDFDKSNLDDWALVSISKIATKLHDNPNTKLDILGYCDYIGTEPYNFKLSDKRVARVKKELVDVWKIDPKRICTDGRGKLSDPKMKYRPNRRCDLFIIQ